MLKMKWIAMFAAVVALNLLSVSPLRAQKPLENRGLEMIPDESEDYYRFENMRVSKETGAPVALYRVNYAVRPDTPENMARQYLRENAALLKIKADLSDLLHTASRETPGGYHVRFLQQAAGYPVYHGDMVVNLDRNNTVTFVMNSYKPRAILKNPAARIALAEGERIAKGYLGVQGKIDFEKQETVVYYNKGITRLAHKINIVPAEDIFGDWEMLIDAQSGEIFRVQDKAYYGGAGQRTATTGSGMVFDPDPLTRARALYQAGGQFGDNNDQDTDSLVAQIVQRDLLDIDFNGVEYRLNGPYAQIVDFEAPFNGLFNRADSLWHFTRNPDAFEAANVYFHLDQSMRYVNETLGFPLMPFQYAGGVKGDPHGLNGADNSHYISSTGSLAWGEGGVDDSEDPDVILHELGHGLHDWLTNGNISQVNGLSEGCGDYWANSYNRSTGFWTSADPQYYWVFQWDGHNEFWSGRITNYTATYPGGLVGQVHTDGQIWSSTLMQIWDDIGRTATDLDFLEALSMTNGASSQEDAAQAFVQADVNLYGGANLWSIEHWFTQRGYNVTIPVIGPSAPSAVQAYSDYTTPNSMRLTWNDPTHFANGDTLLPGEFSIEIMRDGIPLNSLAAGAEMLIDSGLVDGQEYQYSVFAQLNSNNVASEIIELSWIAGGSPVPDMPQNFSIAGNDQQVVIRWANPAVNIDGTPLDDFDGINLYKNEELAATFYRSTADTGAVDSAMFQPNPPGFYEWHITAFDNESPVNESDPTITLGTPLSLPLSEQFTVPGPPNPGIWLSSGVDVNDRAVDPPSPPYTLNLNSSPSGEDIVDLKPIDLSAMQGTGIQFSYFYQPQGSGNAPETGDSLRVYFKNDQGNWALVQSYPGTTVQPFAEEVVDIESAPNGGGSYFHGQFQIRFRSTGGASTFPNDDWFIDDVQLGIPLGISGVANLPGQFALHPNFPNPFNPATTIRYDLKEDVNVALKIYNVLGQEVRVLVSEKQSAGFKRVEWDGRNNFGAPVASGVYIYKIEAGKFVQSRKMVLLR